MPRRTAFGGQAYRFAEAISCIYIDRTAFDSNTLKHLIGPFVVRTTYTLNNRSLSEYVNHWHRPVTGETSANSVERNVILWLGIF